MESPPPPTIFNNILKEVKLLLIEEYIRFIETNYFKQLQNIPNIDSEIL